ncbi:hypothetical protein [Mesorhizobium sp. CAU 1741]|uniref:hypothetical protein n=1 Tax=Mesorhizobium sp. CAU 1741 TaxID=3140366 RepID=UPI00325B2440
MIEPRVVALCDEFGIRIIPGHRYPEIGETRAAETMARILRRHGEAHLRQVLTTLVETHNNKVLLDEVGLWMASDMVRVRGADKIDSDWLDLWDRMPVGELQFIAQGLSGIISQRYALGGMVFERIYKRFGPDADQPDLLDDRRQP